MTPKVSNLGLPRHNASGFALLEIVVGLALSLVVVASGATYMSRRADNLVADAAADHMRTVAQGASAYAESQKGQIEAALSTAPSVSVTVDALKAQGLVPQALRATNAYGQSYAIRFTRGPAGSIEGVVITQGGETVNPRSKRRISSALGLAGGHLDEASMTSLVGTQGGWSRQLADFGVGPGQADLAYALFVEDTVRLGGVNDQYLSRSAVAGFPELNRLDADLDMAGNAVSNVGELSATSLSAESAGLGALTVDGTSKFKGRAEFNVTAGVGPLVNRADRNSNSSIEYRSASGSVFAGQGAPGRFAVGPEADLQTTAWMEVSASGAKVLGHDVWTRGTFDPASKADKEHAHSGSDITTGTVAAARIANLDASKITTGTFNAARIPNLNAAKISDGVLNADRIPNLDASKITTGVFGVDRIPQLGMHKVDGLQASLDARLSRAGGTMLGQQTFQNVDNAVRFVGQTGQSWMDWWLTPDGKRSGWLGYGHNNATIALVNERPNSWIHLGAPNGVNINGQEVFHRGNFNPESKANLTHTHDAGNITSGTLAVARIPNLDASKIASGVLGIDRIPQLPISKVNGLQAALDNKLDRSGGTVTGNLRFTEQTNPLRFHNPGVRMGYMDWYTRTDGARSGWFGIGSPGEATIALVNEMPNGNIVLNTTGTGRVYTNGHELLTRGNLTTLDASVINTGVLATAQIPNLDASKITAGVLNAARIPQLAITKIDGLQAALNGKVSTSGNETIVGEKVFANHVRTTGPHGWYNHTYHGGWMMNDASWVRSIADKGVYSGGTVQSGTLLRSDGNLSVAARTTTNDLVLNSVATCNAACSPNGLQARTSTGAALSCVSGAWKGFSCGTTGGGGGGGGATCSCPPGYTGSSNACHNNSYPYDTIQCP